MVLRDRFWIRDLFMFVILIAIGLSTSIGHRGSAMHLAKWSGRCRSSRVIPLGDDSIVHGVVDVRQSELTTLIGEQGEYDEH